MNYRAEPTTPFVVSGGRTISAIDVTTGAAHWTNEDFGDAAGGALLVTADRIYVAGWRLAGAINAQTGATVWTAKIGANGRPALLREGDRLMIAGSGVVDCLGIDGQLLWRIAVPKANSMTIATGDRVATDDRER